MIKKILIGSLAGLICGLFATGGGMILVPAFIYLLKKEPSLARATSVCCILPMVMASSFFYYKNNYIDWNTGLLCALGGIVGGYFGAKLLGRVPDVFLKVIFTAFLFYISFHMIF